MQHSSVAVWLIDDVSTTTCIVAALETADTLDRATRQGDDTGFKTETPTNRTLLAPHGPTCQNSEVLLVAFAQRTG